ncbi:MAG: IS66 family insertion sequence element accessory protein TnpB [Cellvibrio sp.]|nr:IS66 family insertion sequence element accessory protein TnpB [Cellvibrio sp.]
MIRRNKEQWLSLFQSQSQSGLSAAEFCNQQGLCDKYFSLRKKQLLPSADAFIRVAKSSLSETRDGLALNKTGLQCRVNGWVLQFESLPDAAWLSQLVKALS